MADVEPRPQIGVDEWVSSVEARVERGYLAPVQERFRRVPLWGQLGPLVAVAAFIPLITQNGYYLQVSINTGLFVMLAVGLNVAVGWAGLLDLGYIAFYAFGAYGYALVASGHTGLHWQAGWAIPAVVAATALLGFLLGLPSWRLTGDYLAIVTLFFVQIALTVTNNGQRILSHQLEGGLTRGPNGISDVDPLNLFGYHLTSLNQYFYFLLGAVLVVLAALYFVNESRIGRAWRALREDPLAAELMSMPVDRLKLVAVAFGASVAGLAGAIVSAEQGAVFPSTLDLTVLITLYAMVILGGAGSIGGVVVGAVTINLALEVLKSPSNASWIFYGLLALTLRAVVRPWSVRIAGSVVALTIGFGYAVHAIASAAWQDGVSGTTSGGTWIDHAVRHWALVPKDPTVPGRWAYVLLIGFVLALTVVRRSLRPFAVIPILYLGSCVWENVLVPQAAVTRYILLGAMLVAMMAARPQGLLGKARVEIV